jgi:voltage-gated potassium channel
MPLGRNQNAYDRWTSATDLLLTVLALLWVPVLIIPLVTTVPADVAYSFDVVSGLVWACFALDYLVRFYLAPGRVHWFTHHLLDLAVVALPVFRPLRALRLFRLLELARVGVIFVNAVHRTRRILTHRGLHIVLLAVVGMVFVCAALVLVAERHAPGANIHNYGQALWWGAVTVTTVGYGDRFPVTAAGQAVAVVLMITGIGLIGVLTATVASYFVEEKAEGPRRELDEVRAELAEVKALLLQLTANSTNGSSPAPAREEEPSSG